MVSLALSLTLSHSLSLSLSHTDTDTDTDTHWLTHSLTQELNLSLAGHLRLVEGTLASGGGVTAPADPRTPPSRCFDPLPLKSIHPQTRQLRSITRNSKEEGDGFVSELPLEKRGVRVPWRPAAA